MNAVDSKISAINLHHKRGDLIEAFKIIKGFEDVISELFLPLAIKNHTLTWSRFKKYF